METLLKADIFFFISSVATIALTILAAVLLYYLIKAGKNLYRLSETLRSGARDSQEFIMDLKERLEGNLIFRLLFPASRKKKRPARKEDAENDA